MAMQKKAKLILLLHPEEVPGGTNKQHHSKELEQGFAVLFFSFGTALVIEKIKFEIFSHIPTWYYIKRLLATTGPAAGIQISPKNKRKLVHARLQSIC